MSDTRNHTTRDQLADTIEAHSYTYPDSFCSCHAFVTHATYATHLADVLLASDAIAAVRAAAVAETTAAIEALCDDDTHWQRSGVVGMVRLADVRAALSGGRTALDTAKAEAWDEALEAVANERGSFGMQTRNPYRADTGADQ